MNIENEKPKLPPLSEFLNIYPPLSRITNNISDSKKFFVYFGPVKLKSQKIIEKFKNRNSGIAPNPYPILLEKILKQQKIKTKRTDDVKDAIKLFLSHSNIIEKLHTYFSSQNNNSGNNLVNLEEHIKTVITKLAENVILEKYDENKSVIKYGDIGHDCYFLLSGKISILKPVEYKGINISYHDYLKYLSNLFAKDEMYIALKVIELNNNTFFKFHNLEEIKQDINNLKLFIKSYCILLLYSKLKLNQIECTDIQKIKDILKEFNLSLKDFDLKESEIEENINKINQTNEEIKNNKIPPDKLIKKYILECFTPSEDDRYNMKPYESLLFKNDIYNSNNSINTNNSATLYKYDLFLYLGPGSFFGEMSLELNSSNKKRNATIRTEEECFMFSLTQKLYNSILVASINLIKEYDILFLKKNYFFNQISPKNFDKLYFPMFKLLSKEKNEIIYKQNNILNSVYFLKEGKVKFEISLSVIDIYNLIKYYIQYLSENRRLFNLTDEQIYDLNENYLDHKGDLYFGNKPAVFKDKICEVKKYEIFDVTNYEAIGLLEFMSLKDKYNTSCIVVSKTAKIFEINKENLDIILKREIDIKKDYYKFAKNRFLIIIKRLHSIKYNCLSNIFYKIKQNFFSELGNISYHDEKPGIEIENKDLDDEENYKEESFQNKDSENKFILNTDNNNNFYNSKIYENSKTSPKSNNIKIKKIKLPLTKRFNYQLSDYNGIETQKNNYSGISFKSTKFNENYFIKNRINYVNNINNISKGNDSNTNKSKFHNESYINIINTLLSPSSKNNSFDKFPNIPKSPLKLKKLNNRSSNIINIGKNNFFTLEQLKIKFKEKILDKKMLDLSIVKNEDKKIKKSSSLNYKKVKFNFDIFHKNSFSPFYFHNKKLKKIMLLHNESSNNFSDINTSPNLAINSCRNIFIKK